MMTFALETSLSADNTYESVEAAEIICSAKGLITENTVANRYRTTKDECFTTVYPVPSGTNEGLMNYCIFCGASEQEFPFAV